MALRLCICGSGIPTSFRCPKCRRRARIRRSQRTTTERGYGAAHQRERKRVLAEAGADEHGIGGRCAICGGPGTPRDPLTADHIRPLSMGGVSEPGAYQAVHLTCNVRKGGRNRRGKRT